MSDELQDILAQYRVMKEQRDELLASLQLCADWMEDLRASGDAGFWDWSDGDPYTTASAAIAKATGEPPCAA